MHGMAAGRFCRLVMHLHTYGGAVAAANRIEEGGPPPMAAMPQLAQVPALPPGTRVLGGSIAELKTSDIGDLFSVGRSGA